MTEHPAPPGYEIQAPLGRGGMGVVYRATHIESGAPVALKVMVPESAADEHFRDRFLREMEFLPTLDHPNVIPIFEAGQADGRLYLAMKLVEGCDLKTLIGRRGRLAPRDTIAIGRQLAAALDAAHENGIVHRDVKPQNVLIEDPDSADPHVFLTDFGLVKHLSTDPSVTHSGEILGSIQYMPPEQIEGQRTDGRADVYSLGCLLFECLTGRTPFPRESEIATMWAHIKEEPPRVEAYAADVLAGTGDVIVRALAKDPRDRFLTCGQLMQEFEKGLGEKRVRYRQPRGLVRRSRRPHDVWSPNFFPELAHTRPRRTAVLVTALMAAVGVVTGAIAARDTLVGRQIAEVAGDVRDALPGADTDAVTGGMDRERTRRASQQGPHPGAIATSGRPQGVRTAAPVPVAVTSEADTRPDPSFTVQARPPHAPIVTNGLLAFDRDVGGRSDIFVSRADGSGVRNVTEGGAAGDSSPAWSPSGKTLAFTSARFDNDYDLYVMRADGSGLVRMRTGSGADANPSWSPDARRIAYDNRADQGAVDWTQAGAFTGDYEIRILDVRSGQIQRLAKGFNPAWSPDGDLITFVNGGDIYAIRPDGSGLRQLTDTVAIEESPDWAPDGRSIVYARDGDLFLMNRTGTRVTTLFASAGETYAVQPAWSPDGRWIVYGLVTETERNQLWVISLGGTERHYVTEGRGFVDWQPRREK
jgi:serine/threonine protein kinase/Tol biopolymer transport system component